MSAPHLGPKGPNGRIPFFEKNLLGFNLLQPISPSPETKKLTQSAYPHPNYYDRPLTIVTPPTISNVGPETLFRGAWKKDTKIVMQELNENLSGTRKHNVNPAKT